jgi:hypothetical protein
MHRTHGMFLCPVTTAEYVSEVTDLLHGLETDLARFEVERLLGGKYDKYSCMMCIQSGAGGTEAQDWAGTYLIPCMHGMMRPLLHGYICCIFARDAVSYVQAVCRETRIQSDCDRGDDCRLR